MQKSNKRNAQGTGTIRKKIVTRNDKEYVFWEARYTVGSDPGSGKQIQRSIYGKTQKEVREKLQTVSVQINEGSYMEPAKMTLSEWLDIWMNEYLISQKYSTVKHYKAQVKAHIKPALGAMKLSVLAPHDIQMFYNNLLRGTGGNEPLSPKSVRNVHGILTKALSQAVAIGYLRTNPAAVVTLPRVEKKEIQPLTDAQVKADIKAAEGDEDEIILKVILFTGLRESEAIGLTWDCVDFKTGRIIINKQLQKRPQEDGGFVFAPLKNDKSRTLVPAPFVMDILKDEKRGQAEARLKAGSSWKGWQDEKERATWFVFTNILGEHLHPQTLYNHHKKISERAGAPNARVHDLRHTYAVLSLQNGDDIKTVQNALGHATAAFTLDVYGHVSKKMQDDSAERMQRYFDSINQA